MDLAQQERINGECINITKNKKSYIDVYKNIGCATSHKEERMKKYVIHVSVVLIIGIILIILFITNGNTVKYEEFEIKPIIINYSESDSQIVQQIQLYNEDNCIEQELYSMQEEFRAIESIQVNLEWFLSYKNIVSKYSYVIDPPENVYNVFTEDEIYLIQRTVETECYDQNFESKCNVASVIFNRFEHPESEFGESIEEIITAPRQFSYWRKDISEETKLAVEYAYEIADTTDGCVGFHSNKKTNTFNGWEYSFTDSIGHHFYKERME